MPAAPETFDIRPADPEDPAALACLGAYFDLLCTAIEGVDPALFALPDPGADSYRAPDGHFLIAWSQDRAIGCISLRLLAPAVGEVKRLWVAPEARGLGLARRLLHQIETLARTQGLSLLKLDTNAALTDAIALYRAEGWRDTAPYSPFPSTHWFAKTL